MSQDKSVSEQLLQFGECSVSFWVPQERRADGGELIAPVVVVRRAAIIL